MLKALVGWAFSMHATQTAYIRRQFTARPTHALHQPTNHVHKQISVRWTSITNNNKYICQNIGKLALRFCRVNQKDSRRSKGAQEQCSRGDIRRIAIEPEHVLRYHTQTHTHSCRQPASRIGRRASSSNQLVLFTTTTTTTTMVNALNAHNNSAATFQYWNGKAFVLRTTPAVWKRSSTRLAAHNFRQSQTKKKNRKTCIHFTHKTSNNPRNFDKRATD